MSTVILDIDALGFEGDILALILEVAADATFVDGSDQRAAIRSIASKVREQTRPAIEEPQGLGAVVEDVEGDRITRYCDANDDGEWIGEDGRSWHWGDIDVVRVVWAGVTS